MRPRHRNAYRADAHALLESWGVWPKQEFRTLRKEQVASILRDMAMRKYQPPANSKKPAVRLFLELIQRRAAL